ncbi:MAG: hypothetical protein KDD70_09585 [Bdellovibrionales bacterium]|nr:hypothetical protein [Bdellovibrionales bacterium]
MRLKTLCNSNGRSFRVLTICGIVLTILLAAFAAPAAAQDSGVSYTKLKKRAIRVRNCTMVPEIGISTWIVNKKGNRIRPTSKQNRKGEKLGDKYRFFGCQDSGDEAIGDVLYAKKTDSGEEFAFRFNETDHFKEQQGSSGGGAGLNNVCRSIVQVGGSVIWKWTGSSHFSDKRRFTAGVIVKHGGPSVPGCAEVYDGKGNKLTSMGAYYPAGSEWKSRNYVGWGCALSASFDGKDLARKAQQSTGSPEVYLELNGGSCLRIPNAGTCYNSSQC